MATAPPRDEPPPVDWRAAPWWRPLGPWLATLQGAEPNAATIDELNRCAGARQLRNEAGVPLTFALAREALSAVAYETRIAAAGEVSTRLGGRDDRGHGERSAHRAASTTGAGVFSSAVCAGAACRFTSPSTPCPIGVRVGKTGVVTDASCAKAAT